jgi:hypothetical protein
METMMGQAKNRGTKEQRIAEALLKQEEIVEDVVQENPKYELPYTERIRRHNVKVMMEALKGLPDDYV